MPPTGGPQASHTSMQLLNTLLSQRGPDALPYDEGVKMHIRQHLITVVEEFSSLQAKPAQFTYNDGKMVNLLQADGTIPMYYQDVMYNIPVTIWLLEAYPVSAPRVFVTPTKDMIIKQPHRNVDACGLVSVPYLQNWIYPRSNLVELVRSLSLIFGQDPPLYSRSNSVRSPPPNSFQVVNPIHPGRGTVTRPPSSFSLGPSPSGSQSHPTPLRPHSPYSSFTPTQHTSNTDNSAEVFKRNAVNALVDRLQRDTVEVRKLQEMEMDNLVNTQSLLKQREEQFKRGVQEMQHEKESLEQQLQLILTNTDILETWLKNNDKANLEFDIDDAFVPCDALSRQMLQCASADLAIEDILYALDKAVQEGSIPVDAYLKHVRALSREQFFQRATKAKVRAAQLQAQVTSMAARAASYV